MVKNVGRVPAYRVRAVLESDNPIFDENEMVFGKIAPGRIEELRAGRQGPGVVVHAHRSRSRRRSTRQRGAVKAAGTDLLVNIEGKERPMFAYTYQTIDDQKGSNHDGQVQRGEQVRMLVTVKNIGKGRAMHTEAVLRNGTGQEGILISAGRFEAKELARRRDQDVLVRLRGAAGLQGRRVRAGARGRGHDAGRIGHRQDQGQGRAGGAGARGADRARRRSRARTRRCARRRATARWWSGARPRARVFKTSGKLGAFTRVDVDGDAVGVRRDAPTSRRGGAVHGTLKPEWQVTPPLLTVIAPTVVVGDTVHIKGQATDDRLVRDVYVRVWNRNAKIPVKKAFYQPNRLAGDRTKMEFEADIPLWAGSNLVQVFARESNEVQSLQTVVVLKRAPDGSIVAQPSPAEAPPAAPSGPPRSSARRARRPAPRRHDPGSRGAFQNVGARIHRRRPELFWV